MKGSLQGTYARRISIVLRRPRWKPPLSSKCHCHAWMWGLDLWQPSYLQPEVKASTGAKKGRSKMICLFILFGKFQLKQYNKKIWCLSNRRQKLFADGNMIVLGGNILGWTKELSRCPHMRYVASLHSSFSDTNQPGNRIKEEEKRSGAVDK